MAFEQLMAESMKKQEKKKEKEKQKEATSSHDAPAHDSKQQQAGSGHRHNFFGGGHKGSATGSPTRGSTSA